MQQIQETQAKKLCHEYRSMMRKRIKHGNPQEAKYIVDELTELSVSEQMRPEDCVVKCFDIKVI